MDIAVKCIFFHIYNYCVGDIFIKYRTIEFNNILNCVLLKEVFLL